MNQPTSKKEPLYRVRFTMKDEKEPWEVTAKSVYPSDIMGLICIEEFVFPDQAKMVILPEEDQAKKRFSKTERLHVPYHQLIFIEEIDDESAEKKNLAFMRPVDSDEDLSTSPSE